MDFNKRFLALREVKRRVCQQLGDLQGRLKDTLSALGKDTAALTDPRLLPDEGPELRDQVSIAVCICLHTLGFRLILTFGVALTAYVGISFGHAATLRHCRVFAMLDFVVALCLQLVEVHSGQSTRASIPSAPC